MNKIIKLAGIAGLLAVSFYSLWALDKFQTLDKIFFDGNSISMAVSGETKYHAFKISNPPRIVIEFTNTEFNAREREIAGTGDVKRIRGGQFQNEPVKVARVVIDLVQMVDYEIKSTGNEIKLTFTPLQAAEAKPESSPAPALVQPPASVPAVTPEIPKEAAKAEDAPILIAQPVPPSDATKVIIAPPITITDQQKTASPKPAALAAVNAPKAVVVSKPTAAAETHVVLPKKPITIDFEEADIRDVFRMLSMKSGINIIYSNDVTGTITLRLENVPFDKAFATILSLKNLVSQEQGPNILRIATPQQITDERSQAVTFTKVFPLNYAKADEVKGNLDSIRNAEGRRGSITVDLRTNSLIITDTPEGLISLERIIRELDLKPSQVVIEARIVEVQLTNDFDLGIQWQYANTVVNSAKQTVTIGAKAVDANGVQTPISVGAGGTGVAFPASAVSGQVGGIAFGIVQNQEQLTGVLTALAQKGLSKLLSNPKVTTINNKEARILVGQRIPYTTTTVTPVGSTQSTQFLDVGVKLTVTPTINIDQKITLAVHPEVSLFVRADPAGPVVGTREANTTVIVSNGETVVIGGLITEQDIKQGTGVPLLGDLPIIGFLFKRTTDSKQRSELLVFLTPQIIHN